MKWLRLTAVFLALPLLSVWAQRTDTFTVAAYNVENWVLMERHGKPDRPKPLSQQKAVGNVLATVRPDVLGVEEMGTTNELAQLKEQLHDHGLDYPYHEWIQGADKVRHVALLSRFPIVKRFSRVDYTYLLDGHPMRIQRGILDVEIRVNNHYSFRAIVVHLKSRRTTDEGDQSIMRREEAKLLRAHIGKILKKNPRLNLIVMGDFNDTPDSLPVQTVIGEAPFALIDLAPADHRGFHDTYYWRWHRQYSRIDYLLLSRGMLHEYVPASARIADPKGWLKASDHRTVSAQFYEQEADPRTTP